MGEVYSGGRGDPLRDFSWIMGWELGDRQTDSRGCRSEVQGPLEFLRAGEREGEVAAREKVVKVMPTAQR